MEEKTFFEYEGVKVTNARFVVDGQTFAMGNVTSVKPVEVRPSRVGPLLVGIFGAVFLLGANYIIALVLLALAAAWWHGQKTMFHIMLRTSGGETKALSTHQRNYLEQVTQALNEAIVHRG
ncbi:hypothetical protein KGA65_14655 [Ideonella sp. B7]|uniref:DUF6232 family protein n=1 Tax=Ideonella benzenivorans TaxID=2831643 RepID=UPI001CECE3D0|nr:DUF6232 family protein [Ideonella benzenivorans]MCA6217776.1 hypothetical protein [Ideonella benzenivorans]